MKLTRLRFLASGQYKKGGRMIKDIGIGKKAERQYRAFIKKKIGKNYKRRLAGSKKFKEQKGR
jgi:hypothetical protein